MARSDKLAETHDRLIGAIESLTSGDEWRRMLDVARQFHSYSFGNLMLIGAQAPNATRVAGFRTWKKLGRSVRKGEHGIAILAEREGLSFESEIVSDTAPLNSLVAAMLATGAPRSFPT